MTPDRLGQIEREALAELAEAGDAAALESWRVRYLGRKGRLTEVLRGLGTLPSQERPVVGEAANRLKLLLEASFKERKAALEEEAKARGAIALDITLPGRVPDLGGYHPVTRAIREVREVFAAMGFSVVEGPEVELDYYNFEALNVPQGHPARDMFDTFWITSPGEAGGQAVLLRTHTSPMQVRIMEKTRPPVRVVVPGRVYRYEATDVTHEATFHQIEGLAVDTDVTMADLKGTIYAFVRHFFGEERRVRFRCDYFPFVEPGVEVAIDCFSCRGQGCRLCKGSGWLELFGAGMVHPNVLRRVGYDPDIYSGFAFGGGIERLVMLRHRVDDIRLFFGNDLRFLAQLA